MSFDLNTFLDNHKPKNIQDILKPYLSCRKLNGYIILTGQNINELIPSQTCIRYVPITDAFVNDNYDSHTKYGILIMGGFRDADNNFIKTKNRSQWTHLVLKKRIDQPNDTTQSIKEITFQLKIKKHYIFFKHFSSYTKSKRRYFDSLKITLK